MQKLLYFLFDAELGTSTTHRLAGVSVVAVRSDHAKQVVYRFHFGEGFPEKSSSRVEA